MKCASWSDFKTTCIINKALLIQYEDLGTQYHIVAPEGNTLVWEITVLKLLDDGTANPDSTDFETNYKPTANKPLEIKAGAGRPMRVSASPQPINTAQKFKGFQLTVPANATSGVLNISFPQDIYLKGGTILTATPFAIDDTISLDGVYTAYNMVVVPLIVDNVFLPLSIDQKLDFTSQESMYLASAFSLRLTINSPSGAAVNTARVLNILMTYYV